MLGLNKTKSKHGDVYDRDGLLICPINSSQTPKGVQWVKSHYF